MVLILNRMLDIAEAEFREYVAQCEAGGVNPEEPVEGPEAAVAFEPSLFTTLLVNH